MAEHTILFVDRDAELSERVGAALVPYGCRIVPLHDANDVLTQPVAPSLIILCIDPKRLGWGHAMRIKKHPVLKSVPLVITSAEATEKDFEDHKKLKTRAEEYLGKPFAVEALVDKVRVLLGGLEVQVSGEFDLPPSAVELELDELDVDPVDEFDEASDRTRVANISDMLVSEAVEPAPEPSEAETAAGGAPVPQPVEIPEAAVEIPEAAVEIPEAGSAPSTGNEAMAAELQSLREEHERLQREMAELRARPAPSAVSGPVGAAASREMLGLREVINQKDREVLDLKDALDAKDREILNVRDRLREADRSRGQTEDRLLGVEKELIAAQERLEALESDKELARERERGLKGRLDDAHKKIDRALAEASDWQKRHTAEVERLGAAQRQHEEDKTALLASHEESRRALAESHEEEKRKLGEQLQAAQALARAHDERANGLATEKEQLAVEHAEALAQLRSQAEEQAAAIREQYEAQLAKLRQEHQHMLDQAEAHTAELLQAHNAARDAATTERAEALAALTRSHEAALQALRDRHAGERGALEEQISGTMHELEAQRAEIAQRTAELTETKTRVTSLEAENAAFQEQILKAYHRIKSDESMVARARKALAIALTLLDDESGHTNKTQ